MKIIVDAMGGDHAPEEIVRGACQAAREYGAEILLVGQEAEIAKYLDPAAKVEVVNATQVVTMEDSPSAVMKEKPDSSMLVALKLLAEGRGDAAVSAGNSGALLIQASLVVRRIHGVRRAAFAPVVPTAEGNMLLIDSGANAECKPEYLLQFALMGASCAKATLHKDRPRVGLLNNGTEEHKGGSLQQEAYQLLKDAGNRGVIDFVGNVEAREAILGGVDVLVTDGFTGNIFLKTVEGVGMFFSREIKNIFFRSLRTKLGGLLVKDGLDGLRKRMDYNETGGAPLLGIAKPVIKAHGSSTAITMRSAIAQAIRAVETDSIAETSANLALLKQEDTNAAE